MAEHNNQLRLGYKDRSQITGEAASRRLYKFHSHARRACGRLALGNATRPLQLNSAIELASHRASQSAANAHCTCTHRRTPPKLKLRHRQHNAHCTCTRQCTTHAQAAPPLRNAKVWYLLALTSTERDRPCATAHCSQLREQPHLEPRTSNLAPHNIGVRSAYQK